MPRLVILLLTTCIACTALAQDNRIDVVRHDAPELAHFGEFNIGVRTLEFVDRNRPDVLNTSADGDVAFYDRRLTVEVWYPAALDAGQRSGVQYTTTTRNPQITATLQGRAVRDARSLNTAERLPLVIISHGYPGNRYLMSHLGENLASKGYVVASIDHRDSTYTDQQAFASTLYNRPLDQLFVMDQIAGLSDDKKGFLSDLVDVDRTGIVGYSMGGYGLVINLGGGYSEALLAHQAAPPGKLAMRHAAGNPAFRENLDTRIKAGFAIAPWGMASDVWRQEDLRAITVPTFFLAGSNDEIAGYEDGVRAIYENAEGSDRYMLTFMNAGHNAGAPIPLPSEIHSNADKTGASHYTDPVWDSVRMNNIMDHFATAFFDHHLKGSRDALEYLRLVPRASDGVFSMEDGQPTSAHTYWHGFANRTARGLTLEHSAPSSSATN